MTKVKREDINLAVSIFVAALTIYSTALIIKSFEKHKRDMEAKIDNLQKQTV